MSGCLMILRSNTSTNVNVVIVVILTLAISKHLVVNESLLRSSGSICLKPTGGVVWIPVNSNACTVGDTSCLTFAHGIDVTRKYIRSANVFLLRPAD